MILRSQARPGSIFLWFLVFGSRNRLAFRNPIRAMAGIEDPEMSCSVILSAVTMPFSAAPPMFIEVGWLPNLHARGVGYQN